MSRRMQPIRALADYGLDGNAVAEQTFTPTVGWRRHSWRKRTSRNYLRSLRADGITHLAFPTSRGTLADFTITELLQQENR